MILGLNHVALLVKDVEVSAKFYEEVIALKRIPRPKFDFPGAWFEIGTQQQLHLIGERKEGEGLEFARPRGNHFAIQVSSCSEFEQKLQFQGIQYLPPKKRPDGAIQIFLKDPDGHYVELTELV